MLVSLDYQVGDGDQKVLDKKTPHRLEDIEKLLEAERQNIFYILDNLIKAAKIKSYSINAQSPASPGFVITSNLAYKKILSFAHKELR